MTPSDPSAPQQVSSAQKPGWIASLKVYLEPPSLRMLTLGFSAGLPLLLVLGTLSFWLREAGINRSTIGFLSWVGLAYGFKWCWAPLVDRLPIPVLTRLLGRRRSWLLLSQLMIVCGLVGMAVTDPKVTLTPVVWFALLTAFGSATQDIALDAFRIESADVDRQAALAAAYQTGYRLAMIWAGAGVLWIAARAEVVGSANYDANGWRVAYLVMAASMIVGFITVMFTKEPAQRAYTPSKNVSDWLQTALVEPFADFFRRYGWNALLVLSLIATYRVSDIVMGIMANPFYVDMGYSKDEVAEVVKIYGIVMTLVGTFIGGVLSVRYGVMRILFLGAVMSAASNLLFSWLSVRGHDVTALKIVISADNISSGIASSAFIAYMSSLTNVSYSATQYALLSSMMLLLPKWLAGFSGVAVDAVGYNVFFIGTALIGVPVLLLIWIASRRLEHKQLHHEKATA